MKIYTFIILIKTFLTESKLLRRTFISKAFGKIKIRTYDWNRKRWSFISHIKPEFLEIEYYNSKEADFVCKNYLSHRFNFLGTDWICWNRKESFEKLESYEPIAWDTDVISGFQFRQQRLSSDLIPFLPKGVDVKRLWELGRMNHFPFMALCALINDDVKTEVLNEFKNQITDLIKDRPVGVGVQYYCPMDVGIRCINLLFSYDILRQTDFDKIFSTDFSNRFERFILAQGRYIAENLEYNFVNRTSGNHLLADLCGLLWISAYFDGFAGAGWYKACRNLFLKEIKKQFLSEGSNYECSSGYHRLSCEIAVIGLVAIKWREKDLVFEESILKRLKGMAELLELFGGHDGNMIQIGDIDSGFILKLLPHYAGGRENTLSVDYVLGLLNVLAGRSQTIGESIDYHVALRVMKAFSIKNMLYEDMGMTKQEVETERDVVEQEHFLAKAKFVKQHTCHLERPGSIMRVLMNREFGIIKVVYEHADLFIRSIPEYSKMDMAHAHDDVFHYEVVYSTYRWHPDSGSANYTANREIRMFYASSQNHNTVIHKEPIVSREGVFSASSVFHGGMSYNGDSIYLYVEGLFKHVRKFILSQSFITIVDASDEDFEVNIKENSYSWGYGQMPKCLKG